MALQPHQQRVSDEFTELNEKITKLRAFVGARTFTVEVGMIDQSLLLQQLVAMESYSTILALRIARF